jgi:DNA-3-methyladenine glycosylase I
VENLNRCPWCLGSDIYQKYHDEEWGVPLHDENRHFEFLLLETMQAGLSWITILKRRENYRAAFANFNPQLVSLFDAKKVEELMQNEGIIRNRKKIESAVINAKMFLDVQKTYGSFDKFIWGFTNNKVIKNTLTSMNEAVATSDLSDRVTKSLKSHGFKFVGSTTVYAYLQAIGIINDHFISCFRYNEV